MLFMSSSSLSLTCSFTLLLLSLLSSLVNSSPWLSSLSSDVAADLHLSPSVLSGMLLKQCQQSIIPYPNHMLGFSGGDVISALRHRVMQRALPHSTFMIDQHMGKWHYDAMCKSYGSIVNNTMLAPMARAESARLQALMHCPTIAAAGFHIASNKTALIHPWLLAAQAESLRSRHFAYFVSMLLLALLMNHLCVFLYQRLKCT
ncbi:GP2b protein [Pebjah virus]|uniref:GP2b protein n=1 Tax=Pebjah virus TaxID=1658615 RepID=A0A0G2UMM8_9NIDO|nr:GP2b protein [Pebjah virus]AKI29932.1 GP2b protein [Pebjah virus]AKI29947.1 GP2b protein [Pebjah virus]AKI29962.1 GP2b protein [Pebjah virus]